MDEILHLQYERCAWNEGYREICGLDEAGRGPLAGPVVAGAVILPVDYPKEFLEANDSKKLSDSRRRKIFSFLENRREELVWASGIATVHEIDEINIYQAACLAMQRALSGLRCQPDYLIIDAIRLKQVTLPQIPLIQGDQRSLSVALASIVAKVVRDDIMLSLDHEYPAYGWKNNKGYPTASHLDAIHKYGATPYHRMSFKPLRNIQKHLKPLL